MARSHRTDLQSGAETTQDGSPMSQLTGTRTAHEMRLESISKTVREVEHKSREEF